jgi:phenylpropionate dioxygenase-like ring-hydroxylating dioxygenase large terminal subunit
MTDVPAAPARPDPSLTLGVTRFNNPRVHIQSWYFAMPSRALRRFEAKTLDALNRSIVFFRGNDYRVRALDARCPHLGADLGMGTVDHNAIRCPFHGWTFDGDGVCVGHKEVAVAYPVEERYGAIWFFNGPKALFELPEIELPVVTMLKEQLVACHPHLIASNGLDVDHFNTLHSIAMLEKPLLDQPDAFRTRLRMRVAFAMWKNVDVTFTTIGGNLATIDAMLGNMPLSVLFSHRLHGRFSVSRTFVFVRSRIHLPLALYAVAKIVKGDRELLDRIVFRANLQETDAPLAAFIRQVNEMSVF